MSQHSDQDEGEGGDEDEAERKMRELSGKCFKEVDVTLAEQNEQLETARVPYLTLQLCSFYTCVCAEALLLLIPLLSV